jgi:iron complex transport system permease protein
VTRVAVNGHPERRRGEGARLFGLVALFCLLVALSLSAVTLGASSLSLSTVFAAIFSFDGSREHLVVTMLRLPRVLAALLSGAALAVAGAIMQALTRNPLAEPGLLGVNAGAAFAVVVALGLFGFGSAEAYIWFAFGGAAAAALVVFALGSLGGSATPLKLVLAGAVVGTFLSSLTTALLIFDQATLDTVRLWTVGSLSGRTMGQVRVVAPYIGGGLAAAFLLRGQLTTLSLGADVAQSLGQDPVIWRALNLAIVVLLAGGAVALVGPVGFAGLVVPHVMRLTVGVDYRWLIPFSAVGGAMLLVLADMAGRSLFANLTVPVGVTMALIGAPFFLWLARYRISSGA